MLALEGAQCFRLDGDVRHEANMKALRDFKSAGSQGDDGGGGSGGGTSDATGGGTSSAAEGTTGPRCCLLATVHSGGVGLNIVEASTVVFCDRWPNPTTHAQAIDRTHRIGQTREVNVYYIDQPSSMDAWIAELMEVRERTARMVLKDGTPIGTKAQGTKQALESMKPKVQAAKLQHGLGLRPRPPPPPPPPAPPAALANGVPTSASPILREHTVPMVQIAEEGELAVEERDGMSDATKTPDQSDDEDEDEPPPAPPPELPPELPPAALDEPECHRVRGEDEAPPSQSARACHRMLGAEMIDLTADDEQEEGVVDAGQVYTLSDTDDDEEEAPLAKIAKLEA